MFSQTSSGGCGGDGVCMWEGLLRLVLILDLEEDNKENG